MALFLPGCSHPNVANNKLRDDNQKLRDQITDLDRRHTGDEATIRALEGKQGIPPMVSSAKLEQLFTVHAIKLGRLTGGDDWDSQPGQHGIKVAVEPMDGQGDKIKAAGSFVIDAYDLAASGDSRIGHWTFDLQQSRQAWNGASFLYCYVLKCPWQKTPGHSDITVRVTFTDALTGRQFSDQKVVKIETPATRPATTPARPPS